MKLAPASGCRVSAERRTAHPARARQRVNVHWAIEMTSQPVHSAPDAEVRRLHAPDNERSAWALEEAIDDLALRRLGEERGRVRLVQEIEQSLHALEHSLVRRRHEHGGPAGRGPRLDLLVED